MVEARKDILDREEGLGPKHLERDQRGLSDHRPRIVYSGDGLGLGFPLSQSKMEQSCGVSVADAGKFGIRDSSEGLRSRWGST